MRRSPFYSYPAYDPFRSPHSGLYASDAYHPLFSQPQRRPSSTPASSPPAPRKVINVPVFDSAAPPSAPSPASPKSKPSAAHTAPSIDPASAATLIQACFRGFFIRRHRPLVHLRAISASRKQLEALKAELESPGFSQKVRSNEKERLRFSESVMAVILRLDAIEGSVPEIRSQRKEATKMAIKLQDAIDAITSQKEEELDSESANVLSLPEAGDQTESSQEATGIIPEGRELMVQENGLGPCDVNIAQETATTIRGEGPDSHDSNVIQANLQDDDSIPSAKVDAMQVLEDSCVLQDKPVSMSNVQEGERVEATDETEHKVEPADQEENIAQGELVEAMNVLEEHDKRQAPHHDDIPHLERHEVQAADSDFTCAFEENGNTSCANKANQENVDVMGLVVNGDVVTEKLQECGSVRQDDETSAKDGVNLSPGTPRAEERPNAVKSSTGDYTADVEQFVDSESPCATEQFKDKSSTNEASVVCGNGLQHLDQVIPTDCALRGGSPSSDHELLKHLSEECGQLRSLIARLLAQNQVQSKVICALGDKLEMLEQQQQQQQLISSHNNQHHREKRKPRKGAARK